MPQRNIDSIFEAEAVSLADLYNCEGGVAGFKIPIYQRPYDWDQNNISRLFEDISSGLYWSKTDPNSLSFLGTVIVLDEQSRELSFDGRSLSIIDGQQRLTTISIVACLLYETIEKHKRQLIDLTHRDIKQWLDQEADYLQIQLLNFIRGQLSPDGVTFFPFPRIIRHKDNRAKSYRDAEYISLIAKFLFDFSHDYLTASPRPSNGFLPTFSFPSTDEGKTIKKNIQIISSLIEVISASDPDFESDDTSIQLTNINDFSRPGLRMLFEKLPAEIADTQRLLSAVTNYPEILGILRLLSFVSFLMKNVIVTLVKVTDEKYGFDIFDALNTTGAPLTAIQTFKPQVIRYEKTVGRYENSESESHFKEIERYTESFTGTTKKQNAAKELVVTFALYKNGEKRSKSLDDQRRYLKNSYDGIGEDNQSSANKRLFTKNLAEVAMYRRCFWESDNLELQHNIPERELVSLCLTFLRDLKNALSIPILARFYFSALEQSEYSLFSDAVKALTAFVVLRRAFTGGTANIDSDLRGIMQNGPRRRTNPPTHVPLNVGLVEGRNIVSISTFKEYLKDWLTKPRINITEKESWIERAAVQPLYSHSGPLCRFLLLSAFHNARQDPNDPWKLRKTRPSREVDLMNVSIWRGLEMSTLEHIAPESGPKPGWDQDIYTQPHTKDCIGNLILLPQKENSVLGDRSWEDKKILFEAFASGTPEELSLAIEKAESRGFNFGKKTMSVLQDGNQLPIVGFLSSTPPWSKEIIESRAENLLGLVWDEISPWIFE
ncbi:DUF262 domain-containing protein [Lewinella sp. LCG006]|uniref:GmrSD restriction endonuclease domain-containing protein n=1 Tax=Lewinella sp. LCG006 TaxID=3231911 RepID=UPI00346079C4